MMSFVEYCACQFYIKDYSISQTARDVCADKNRPKTINKWKWHIHLKNNKADQWAHDGIEDLIDGYREYLDSAK